MKTLAILGASGHGKVVAEAAELAGWKEVSFFDDAWPDLKMNGPWPVQGTSETLLCRLSEFEGVVVGIGDNAIRRRKQQMLEDSGASLVTIVHPSAVISPHSTLGSGSVVFANSVVNACSLVSKGTIVNTSAVIEHDCDVGDFCHIGPNSVLAGGVKVGRLAWIGACASVRQLISVGEGAIVGMGSAVVKDVASGETVAGSPARRL